MPNFEKNNTSHYHSLYKETLTSIKQIPLKKIAIKTTKLSIQVFEESLPMWVWLIKQIITERSIIWTDVKHYSLWWRWRIITLPGVMTTHYILGKQIIYYYSNKDRLKHMWSITTIQDDIASIWSGLTPSQIIIVWMLLTTNKITYRWIWKSWDILQAYQKYLQNK